MLPDFFIVNDRPLAA